MARITTELNRVISQMMTGADLISSMAWLGLNVNNSGGQVVLIDGFELAISVFGADYTNLQFVQVIMTEDVNLDSGQRIDVQLPPSRQDIFNSFTQELSQRVLSRTFTEPLICQPNKRYCIIGQAFYSVFAGPANYQLAVYGRTAYPGQKDFPLILR